MPDTFSGEDRDELIALAERCERASGADREIDRDIGLILGLYDRPEDLGCFVDPAEAVVGGGGQTFAPPTYTASLDAAMTLVPEGEGRWPQMEYIGPNPNNKADGHRVKIWRKGKHPVRGEHPSSFAMAIAAAALRALATQNPEEIQP